MRILFCHEFYYLRGGAERYMFELMDLLEKNGHEVIPFSMHAPENKITPYEKYFVDNIDFPSMLKSHGLKDAFQATRRSIYSIESKNKLLKLIKDTNPDLIHIFGFAHYLSASILDAAKESGIFVIQSMLDYKWVCPNSTLYHYKYEELCERCKNDRFYNMVVHRCKRNSLPASMLASIQAYYGKWTNAAKKINVFLCHSQFMLEKMVEYGYPREKFRYLPHLLDLDQYPHSNISEPYAVSFGRISGEKGLSTLLKAAEIAKVNVKLIGDGPEKEKLSSYASEHGLTNVEFLGKKWGQEMQDIVSKARYTVCPSVWYENSPIAIYEAMAMGRPIIGSNMGGIPELVQDHVNGLLFQPRDFEDLAAKMRFLMDNESVAVQWGLRSRQIAEEKFSPAGHLAGILDIYQESVRYRENV